MIIFLRIIGTILFGCLALALFNISFSCIGDPYCYKNPLAIYLAIAFGCLDTGFGLLSVVCASRAISRKLEKLL